MQNGDHVDVTVIGRQVGPGRIIDAPADLVRVLVRRPSGDDYEFAASRTFFTAAGHGRWRINMPGPTLREFLPDHSRTPGPNIPEHPTNREGPLRSARLRAGLEFLHLNLDFLHENSTCATIPRREKRAALLVLVLVVSRLGVRWVVGLSVSRLGVLPIGTQVCAEAGSKVFKPAGVVFEGVSHKSEQATAGLQCLGLLTDAALGRETSIAQL